MLKLNIIAQNPAAVTAITWVGIILFALVAVMAVGLWIVVAQGRARRDIQDFDDSGNDRDLEVLRHLRLVVRPPRTPSGPDDAVVAELERDDSEPTTR